MKPLEKAKAAREAALAAGETIRVRSKREVFEEKNTRKTAIDLFCCECMGGVDNPGYRSLVRDCTCGPRSTLPCPLYDWRPYQ